MFNRIEENKVNGEASAGRGNRTLSKGQIKAIQEGKARIETAVRSAFAARGSGFACIEIATLRAQVGIGNSVEEKWFQEILKALQAQGFQRSNTGESICVRNKD